VKNLSEIIVIKEISSLALFFSVINFITVFIYEPKPSYGTFALVLLVVSVNEMMKLKSKVWPRFLLVLLIIPFIWSRNLNDMLYYTALGLFAVYTSLKPAKYTTYINSIELFKRGAIITVAMLFLAVASSDITILEEVSMPYSMLYFIASVILLRTLRYTEYNKSDKRMTGINLKYSAAITLVAFLAGIKPVREITVITLNRLYQYLIHGLLTVFSWVFIVIGYIVQIIIDFISSISMNNTVQEGEAQGWGGSGDDGTISRDFFNKIISSINESQVLSFILKVLIFSVILYMSIKLLKRKYSLTSFEEDYIESREKMTFDNEGGTLSKRLSTLLKPKSPSEYIRFYYRKYLLLSIKKDVDITTKDTTLEIKQKTGKVFSGEVLDKMRDIYIKVRYGEYAADKNASKEFRKHYDEIESSK
jgi:hypothetical protein